MKFKKLYITILLMVIGIVLCGCSSLKSPQITANSEVFGGGDKIVLNWDEVKNADSYKVNFYIYPLSENKLARSIELTPTEWEGVMPAGKYDVVVYAKKNSSLSESSNKITITIESQSIPSWDDINYIFNSTGSQIENKYGLASFQSDTGTSIIKSYDDPIIDLTYLNSKPGTCSQIDINDSRFILFGLRISVNTQAELISALTQNKITYENSTTDSTAGVSKSTTFTYNKYNFTVYIDKNNKLSRISIQE